MTGRPLDPAYNGLRKCSKSGKKSLVGGLVSDEDCWHTGALHHSFGKWRGTRIVLTGWSESVAVAAMGESIARSEQLRTMGRRLSFAFIAIRLWIYAQRLGSGTGARLG
jgi:hypothetical protein